MVGTKAPLCKGSCREATEGLLPQVDFAENPPYFEQFHRTIPPAAPPPFAQGRLWYGAKLFAKPELAEQIEFCLRVNYSQDRKKHRASTY